MLRPDTIQSDPVPGPGDQSVCFDPFRSGLFQCLYAGIAGPSTSSTRYDPWHVEGCRVRNCLRLDTTRRRASPPRPRCASFDPVWLRPPRTPDMRFDPAPRALEHVAPPTTHAL